MIILIVSISLLIVVTVLATIDMIKQINKLED
jgi:hypothetical protein